MEEKAVTFSDLKLVPGQVLNLEFEGYTNDRDKAYLIGYRAHYSLIITTPLVNGVLLNLKPEQSVRVRFFSSKINSVCAFESKVIYSTKSPYPHVHLTMPDSVVLGEVRQSTRAEVDLVSVIEYVEESESKSTTARLLDLSTDGARLIGKTFDFGIDTDILVTFTVEVTGIECEMKLEGKVRSKTKIEQGFSLGVQFEDVKPNDRLALQAYVLSRVS